MSFSSDTEGTLEAKHLWALCHIQTPGKLNYWLLVGGQRTMACFERWMSKGGVSEGDSTLSQPLFNMHVCWQSAPFRSGWRKIGKLQHSWTSRATLLDKLINVSVCWLPHQCSLCTSCLLSIEFNTGWWRQQRPSLPLFSRDESPFFSLSSSPLSLSLQEHVKCSGKILSELERGLTTNSIFSFFKCWLLESGSHLNLYCFT